jgi:ubiquitin-protein ligase
MSVRMRRLQAEYERLKVALEGYQFASIVDTFGRPPEKYVIEYHLTGLTDDGGEIRERDVHRAEITLGMAYPREMPRCVMLTPVFHPNIDHLAICTEDIGSAGQTLDQIIIFIAELITFQAYNLQSPRNGDAARWTKENQDRIPIDAVNLFPPAWLNGRSDIEIAQAADAELRKMLEAQPTESTHSSEEIPSFQAPAPVAKAIRCENCGRSDALAGLISCSRNHQLCEDCRVTCVNCAVTLCLLCAIKHCSVCSKLFCDDCCLNCKQCSQLVCLTDARLCRTCKEWVCGYHLDLAEQCPSCAGAPRFARLAAGN